MEEPILQACALPYRRSADGLEFCLITALASRRWGFPKGIVDPGETPAGNALKEAYEEAGLAGQIVGEPLGQYTYSKWDRTLLVTAFAMQVEQCHDDWQEARLRQRCWCSPDEARRRLAVPDQRRLLDLALQRLATPPGASADSTA
ncbi:MAG: NUDIX hydrolase [Pirellulales bacterium]